MSGGYRPYAIRAAIKQPDGVWWRTLAYCEGCGKRMGLTTKPAWCRVKIRLPEFRRNAICRDCLDLQRRGILAPSVPWWTPLMAGGR